ncbi:class I SAM-dependent methyltransferase [Kribbella sancticallisti]|uniref:Class I SAM-dependent methyltransferase n=1 Tax=Kribbella sancticallisti TaxID=460087 RepID=A0ABN2E3B4_9ACTN
MTARYNGLADWYDARFVAGAPRHQPSLPELLGPGSGRCLDLGCGTGRNFDTIRDSGRSVVGVDHSADQLRLARTRTDGPLIEADAAMLPFDDASFDTVLAMWISTDLDDFTGALTEATRVLRPGGLLVCYGVHPCFNGPHIEWNEDGSRLIHPSYRTSGWHEAAPYWADDGIRRRVGMRHRSLPELLNAFLRPELTLEHFEEPDAMPVPHSLAIKARRN